MNIERGQAGTSPQNGYGMTHTCGACSVCFCEILAQNYAPGAAAPGTAAPGA